MTTKTVGIVATGVIGASWAGLFLAHGLKVIVADPAPGAADKLTSFLQRIWPTLEDTGLGSGASLDNFRFVGASLGPYASEVDFIQENAPENIEIKSKLLAELDRDARKDVIIESSSSGIPSSALIGLCKNPERVLIGHPFSPPHLMPLVEVVPHPGTSESTISEAMVFFKCIGRNPVCIKQEVPGFVANRLQTGAQSSAA
ncbi:hypothetical protein KC320_g5975 [Hortaea werneckii]|nr:hypothetical protein KC320_g5975 [Hortaea werneckii]